MSENPHSTSTLFPPLERPSPQAAAPATSQAGEAFPIHSYLPHPPPGVY